MNKSNIIEWIDNPATVDEDATRELREIIQEFPASPILHWLYLKGLQNQKSYLFNSALTRAAIGSPNRSQLLEWVGIEQPETEDSKKQRFEFVIPEIENEPEAEVEKEEKDIPTVVEEKKAEPKRVEPVLSAPKAKKKEPADLPDDIKALLEKSKRIRAGYNEVHPSEVDESKEVPVTPVYEEPETKVNEVQTPQPIAEKPDVKIEAVTEEPEHFEVQEEAYPEPVEVSIEPVVVEKTEEMSFSIEEPQDSEKETYFSIDLDLGIREEADVEGGAIPQVFEVENSFSIELEDYSIQEEEKEIEVENPDLKEVLQSDDADFTTWLKTLKSEKPEVVEKPKSVPEKKPIQPKEEISFELVTDVVPPKPKKVDPVKDKKIELIDKFLEERPKITPRKEDFSLLNIADNFEDTENQFVTETLAKVYLAQGHLNKAIEAYEILGLKYPEKNTFFADRIRDIKRRK